MTCYTASIISCADGVQLSAMPDQEPECEEESSSGEEDMSEGDPVSMIGSNTELPAASAALEEGSRGQAALQELLQGRASASYYQHSTYTNAACHTIQAMPHAYTHQTLSDLDTECIAACMPWQT